MRVVAAVAACAVIAVILVDAFCTIILARRTEQESPITTALYYSGATFFTIQMPDAQNAGSKIINVIEGGMGFSFLGLAISYIPTLYTNYSSRELRMFLLEVEAGSPPCAASFLVRHGPHGDLLQTRLSQ